MMQTMAPPAIALNRFGLGARPDEAVPADPRAWLMTQLDGYDPALSPMARLPSGGTALAEYFSARRGLKKLDAERRKEKRGAARQQIRSLYRSAVDARLVSALVTPTPFVERLVHFWANHFAVSVDKQQVTALAGAFEAEAIRPHVLGRFEDLLLAAECHPAMLVYLDQARSVGPGSDLARRATPRKAGKQRGLNENLAREIMELHTLGVRSGYSQADVTEFARALTGLTVGGAGPASGSGQVGKAAFRPAMHEPGMRTILGQRFDQTGDGQAAAVLRMLGTAPATARHVSTKLARHFAGDDPPPALVERLTATFTRTGGDLPALYRVLIEAPEAWTPAPLKFKSPWEWTVSALRGLGRKDLGNLKAEGQLRELGQPVWKPGSPAGYDDIAATWAGPNALLRRVELAQRLVAPMGTTADPRALAARLLPSALSASTAIAVARAESVPAGLALLLVSPDFLRR
jgi:uncharacterized protein (DUF1800 family)